MVIRLALICFSIAFAWYGLSTWLLRLFEELHLEHKYLGAISYALSGASKCASRLKESRRARLCDGHLGAAMCGASQALSLLVGFNRSELYYHEPLDGMAIEKTCFEAFWRLSRSPSWLLSASVSSIVPVTYRLTASSTCSRSLQPSSTSSPLCSSASASFR